MGLDHPHWADGMMNNAVANARKRFLSILHFLSASVHDLHKTCTDENGHRYSGE